MFCPWEDFLAWFYYALQLQLSVLLVKLDSGEGRTEPAIRCPGETNIAINVLIFRWNNLGD